MTQSSTSISSMDQLNKKKMLESLQALNFKEIATLTDQLLKQSSNHDFLFRIGIKTLGTFVNLKQKHQFYSAYDPFMKWFNYCFNYDHKQYTKNNVLYYAIMFVKALCNEKQYTMSIELLERIQNIYTFMCDNVFDAESEKFMKFLAPLCYNISINKELIVNDADLSIILFKNGIKFYLKIFSNMYVILNSLRLYEQNFIKGNKLLDFYEDFLSFIVDSINEPSCNKHLDDVNDSKHLSKQIYMRKFLLSIYLQFYSVCYLYDELAEEKKLMDRYSSIVSSLFNKKFLKKCESNRELNDKQRELECIRFGMEAMELVDLLKDYLKQFRKKTIIGSTTSSSSSSSSPSGVNRMNASTDLNKVCSSLEIELKLKFTKMFTICLTGNCLYLNWIFNNLMDFFQACLNAFINGQTLNGKFLQESLIDTYATIAYFYSENSKSLYFLNDNSIENLPKMSFYKPINFFNSMLKIMDIMLKTNNQTKVNNSESLLSICETLIQNQLSYMKWIIKVGLNIDEFSKYYSFLESHSAKISNNLYSDTTMTEYIKFQNLALEISIDRLKFMYDSGLFNVQDLNSLKNFRNISENLLLSLRFEEKFDESKEVIKKIYEFMNEYHLDKIELEWLTTNWCKIKRDLWKSKKRPYTDEDKKLTIVDYLNIQPEHQFVYLFEELKTFYYLRSIDSSIAMFDEIYYTLEKLDSIEVQDPLLKSRIYLEIAQLKCNNYCKNIDNKFKLTSDEYCDQARMYLYDHKCGPQTIEDHMNDLSFKELDEEDKENTKSKPQSGSSVGGNNKKRLSSPTTDEIFIEETNNENTTKKKLPKRRRVKPKSPMTPKNAQKLTTESTPCQCVQFKITHFQIGLFTFLCSYSKTRSKMLNSITNLIESRIKVKDTTTITTNADNLHLQTTTNECLICSEFTGDNEQNNKEYADLLEQLDGCLRIFESLLSTKSDDASSSIVSEIKSMAKTLQKQLYDSIDLLAQLYGFFGYLNKRCTILNQKFELLNLINQQSKSSSTSTSTSSSSSSSVTSNLSYFELIYANAALNLMKSYLSLNMCDSFETVNNQLLNISDIESTKTSTTSSSKTSSKKTSSKTSNGNDNHQYSLDTFVKLAEENKYLSTKSELLVSYYLVLAQYLILKHRCSEAMKLIKEKILKSSVLTGKQTSNYYEARYYLKYLQFYLSMINVEKLENELSNLLENETPLSLLEDCYTSAFSVARYFVENSVEPSRTLTTSLLNEQKRLNYDQIFFDIGNAECYRIISEFLDISHLLCKYYIEISRYRDAVGYIKEGLDITQLHFTKRRLSLFLVLQINCDLIANCTNEATSRLQVATNLISNDSISNPLEDTGDLYQIKNYIQLSYSTVLKELRKPDACFETLNELLQERLGAVNKLATSHKAVKDYCKDVILELNLLAAGHYLKPPMSKSNRHTVQDILKSMKRFVYYEAQRSDEVTSIREKWHLSDYYCCLFELDEVQFKDYLYLAYMYIKKNPPPTLYRRVCMNLFKVENDQKKRIIHLLETQSIALRHKACSIQIKHKRKSNIDLKLFDTLIQSLSFSCSSNREYFSNFLQNILPDDCVVVGLLLGDADDLYLIRIEKSLDPVLIKLKFNRKYLDEFKQLMVENDRSMKQSDRNKFWSSRNALNKKLNNYLDELESRVFSYYKSYLLGSYLNYDLENFINKFREYFNIETMSREKVNSLKMIILGLEFFTNEELTSALKNEFEKSDIRMDDFILYLMTSVKPKLADAKRKHVCLLVDKYLHQIPWECLPSTKNQPISRMPSIHFLSSLIQINSVNINKDNAFYIVDPGNDLTHTREKFQSFFERLKTWNGIIGVPPNEATFKKALTEYELFIYTGHGSGSQYYPSDDVQKLRVQACSILMGCSSGSQYVLGDFEPYGTVLAYIIAGCPCVVGNLWDVTDRDIDRLTEEFLESWIKEYEQSAKEATDRQKSKIYNSICNHLIKARKACKMAYLNGSAPIVYGLPVKFK